MRISDWSSDVCSSDLPRSSSRNTDRVGITGSGAGRGDVFVGRSASPPGLGYLVRPLNKQENDHRSEEHTSELQSLMRISYAVFCLKKKNTPSHNIKLHNNIIIYTQSYQS